MKAMHNEALARESERERESKREQKRAKDYYYYYYKILYSWCIYIAFYTNSYQLFTILQKKKVIEYK